MTYCVTCSQTLSEGMKHPEFFAQNLLTPDPTSVHDLHQELEFLLSDIKSLLNVLYDREADRHEEHRDTDALGIYGLLQNITAEAERRAMRLRNAGLYWQGEDPHVDSLFPDMPLPRQQTEDCPHTVIDSLRGCKACSSKEF